MQSDEHAMKDKFYSILKELIKRHGIKFVGEECKPGQRTIPRALAEELGCTHAEIDMPLEERRNAGIPDDYQTIGGVVLDRAHELREDYMLICVTRSQADPKLIICGSEHMERLKVRFEALGERVVTRNVTAEPWFDPPYKKIERGEL